MNYGEELAYWYLRLNGFIPISNFVIHKSASIKYTSDCDILAVRLPNVYEEIGGRPDDWDAFLQERVRQYPAEKYRDRMFFGSILFQEIIDTVALERGDNIDSKHY